MRVGFLERDITPTTCVHLGGSLNSDYSPRVSSGLSDPLYLKTILITDDDRKVKFAIFVADLIWVSKEISDDVRIAVSKILDTEVSRIIVSASHTHSGPETMPNFYGAVPSSEYAKFLKTEFRRAAREVRDQTDEATFQIKSVPTKLNVNRRKKILDTKALRRGKLNFDYQTSINIFGKRDDIATVLKITRKNSRNVLLINFSAHPAFLMRSSLISADWPGALQEVWNTNSETDDNVVFLQGFCGDLLPASFQINKIDRFSIGGVLDFFSKPLKFRTSNSINSARKFTAKFVKNLKTDESPWRSVESNDILIRNEAVFLEYELKKYSQSCRFRISENSQKQYGEHCKLLESETGRFLDVSVADFGGFKLVSCDAEMFSSYSKFIRSQSNTPIMSIGFCNGMIGYVPDKRAIVQGGYEPRRSLPIYGQPYPYSEGIEKTIKTKLRNLINPSC